MKFLVFLLLPKGRLESIHFENTLLYVQVMACPYDFGACKSELNEGDVTRKTAVNEGIDWFPKP